MLPGVLAMMLAGAAGGDVEDAAVQAPPVPRVGWWQDETPRLFTATLVDFGFLFVQPRFQLGYGLPHLRWVGLELAPTVSLNGVGAALRANAEFERGEFRIGARYLRAFRRTVLAPASSYDLLAIDEEDGTSTEYLTWEARLTLLVPVGPGEVFIRSLGALVTFIPRDQLAFEEALRVVTPNDWVLSQELGYLLRFERLNRLRFGPTAEVMYVAGRDRFFLRVGVRADILLFRTLELRCVFRPPVAGPDELGARGGRTFLFGLRHRWGWNL